MKRSGLRCPKVALWFLLRFVVQVAYLREHLLSMPYPRKREHLTDKQRSRLVLFLAGRIRDNREAKEQGRPLPCPDLEKDGPDQPDDPGQAQGQTSTRTEV